MNLIACVDKNWGIGKNGSLLFSIKQDMEFFKSKTIGKTVVMGRKTFDTLGKPLKGRKNVVLTHNPDFKHEGVIVCRSVDEVLKICENDEIFVIGGSEIYERFLPYCKTAYITKVDAIKDADAYMVNLDKEKDWELARETKDFLQGKSAYRFAVYEKTGGKSC